MTQEELDALMAGGIDDEMENLDLEDKTDENIKKDNNNEHNKTDEDEGVVPPPADSKNKVVAQLDEVTKESEEKAVQILEKMDEISAAISDTNEKIKKIIEFLTEEKALFTKLHNMFPHIKKFEEELQKIEEIIKIAEQISKENESAENEIFTVMDIMQYQDIHRQKIERVINIMRALIKYMNRLFEGKIEDEARVKSARHLQGDETEEVVSDEDIEKLLEKFGAK
jgi:predicted RNase H-like nuclease (RuvC/YqgF family)